MMTTPAELLRHLDALGIAHRTLEHEAVFTVAASARVKQALPGGHTKNLLLRDGKGRLLLVVAEDSTRVDLKGLHRQLGCGRLSFAPAELLVATLGVQPGSVTALALVNDAAGRVGVVVDANLLRHDTVNCHPLVNTATTNIAREDLLRFIRCTGHEPVVLQLDQSGPAGPGPGNSSAASGAA